MTATAIIATVTIGTDAVEALPTAPAAWEQPAVCVPDHAAGVAIEIIGDIDSRTTRRATPVSATTIVFHRGMIALAMRTDVHAVVAVEEEEPEDLAMRIIIATEEEEEVGKENEKRMRRLIMGMDTRIRVRLVRVVADIYNRLLRRIAEGICSRQHRTECLLRIMQCRQWLG